MASRKVFAATLGFYDTVIAAPSRTSALAAWGAKYDLFKYGGARVETDPEIVKAAMAKPGIVLRRPVGTNEPYCEDPDLPSAETLKRAIPKRAKAFPTPAKKNNKHPSR